VRTSHGACTPGLNNHWSDRSRSSRTERSAVIRFAADEASLLRPVVPDGSGHDDFAVDDREQIKDADVREADSRADLPDADGLALRCAVPGIGLLLGSRFVDSGLES
jgi:hypothetical protein